MGGGGEDDHVHADLGDDVLGADHSDAVHGVELGHLVQAGLGQRLDLGGELAGLGGVVVDGDQHHRQHGGVLIGEEGAFQRLFQAADLAAHRAAGQLGQGPGVALAGGEPVEHVPAGRPVDVGVFGRHEAGRDHAPLYDPGEPDRVGPVLWPFSALACAGLITATSSKSRSASA